MRKRLFPFSFAKKESERARPLLLKERSVVMGEIWGTLVKMAAILGIFFFAPRVENITSAPLFNSSKVLASFGPLLFSLAAWPAVSQMAALRDRRGDKGMSAAWSLVAGTFISGVLYFLFIVAVVLGAVNVSADTVSGISAWPLALRVLLGVVGVLGAWTVSLSVGLELSETLQHDAKIDRNISNSATILLPIILIFSGLSNASPIIAFSGGVLVALQYLLILTVSRNILRLKGFPRVASIALELVFLLAAGAEIYYFMPR